MILDEPMPNTIKHVAIAGGGTAGWITAALLVRLLGKTTQITLVESDQIATVGVGEASIPPILSLNQALGIDEADFIKHTNATIKLGIQFENWGQDQQSYMHAFGALGKDFPFCGFEHLWARGLGTGDSTDLWDYSLNYQAAKRNKFAKLDQIPNANMGGLVYAYHFDAGLYAQFLRRYSEQRGVTRTEGIIDQVNTHGETGDIQSLSLRDGRKVDADFFIDCSGFKALLIGQALGVTYEDWSHWLPCDRAVAVQSKSSAPAPKPYTQSIAHKAGWRWRIPLQTRVGNGLVFSREHLSDDEAHRLLLDSLDGEPTTEPRFIAFKTGRRQLAWQRNCVAVGLSSGFLEPLESTSIHMIQTAVIRLIKLFPHCGVKDVEADEYNRQTQDEIEHIRDFIILHYHLNQRPEPFWARCRDMTVPDTLADKIRLFEATGKVHNPVEALFSNVAWHQVMIGQGLMPNDYHPLADALSPSQLSEYHRNIKAIINQVVEKLPTHQAFLDAISG